MKRGVDRGPRGELALRQPRHDLLDRERVVADELGVLLDVGERGLGGLVVALDRLRLAVADLVAVPELEAP